MITYAQIPSDGSEGHTGFVEPVIVRSRLPPEGATIHAARGIPDSIATGSFSVEFDHEKAKPGDWLEITIPDVPLLPTFTPMSPLTTDERQRAAQYLFGFAIRLDEFVKTFGDSPGWDDFLNVQRKEAADARALAVKLAAT